MVTNETSPEKRCAWTLYFEQNGVSLTKLINSRSNDRSKSVFSFGFARTQKCKSNQSILLFFWCHMKFKEKEIASIRRIANVSLVISIAYSANIFLSLRMITFQVTRPNRDECCCELLSCTMAPPLHHSVSHSPKSGASKIVWRCHWNSNFLPELQWLLLKLFLSSSIALFDHVEMVRMFGLSPAAISINNQWLCYLDHK